MKTARPEARSMIERVRARATLARVAILSELIEAGRPLSHQEVLQRIDPPLDRVTAYRVFDWLESVGLAHKISAADRATRFSVSRSSHGHAHFQCETCGHVYCLDEVPISSAVVPAGFVLHSVDMTVKGLCARCAKVAAGES